MTGRARKAVERAFGIVQRKFQIVARPMELHYVEDIKQVVETAIILHNMMVEVRVDRDQQETIDWYEMAVHKEDDNTDQ